MQEQFTKAELFELLDLVGEAMIERQPVSGQTIKQREQVALLGKLTRLALAN